jgi:hypothetical protein
MNATANRSKAMRMIVDSREYLGVDDTRRIEAAYAAIEDSECETGRQNRNAVRRYYRLIRSISGIRYVTCHHIEHNSLCDPSIRMVAFGRSA